MCLTRYYTQCCFCAGGHVLDPVKETKAVVAQAPQLHGKKLGIVPYVHLGVDSAAAVRI